MIRAYDLGGDSRGFVPAPLSSEWVAREGELATLKVSYSELAPRAEELEGVVEVAYLLPTADGQGWVEPPNARMRAESDGWERLADGARVHSYDFVSLAAEFSHHYLTQGATAERTFGSVTAGAIVKAFVDEVKADGGLPWLALGFTPTTDSRGEAWPHYLENGATDGTQVQTEVVPLRTKDLLTLLQGLARVQWWMQGRTLHVAPWKPGADVPVYLPDVLMTESPEKINHGGVYSHVRIIGDEGAHWLFPVPGANPAYGKRIKVVQAQGVTSEAQAALLAETEYPAARDAAESFTRAWRVMDGTPWVPGRDLQLGDKITADTKAGRRIEARIAGMSVKEDKAGRGAFVTLGTVQDGLLLRMAKQSRQQQGGVGVIYGTPKPAPPPVAGRQWPEAPQNVTATLSGWPLPGGGHGGVIGASWDAVTVDTANNALEVDAYTVRARKQGTAAWIDPLFRTDPDDLAGNAQSAGGLVPGDTWEVQVAAMEGDDTGIWSAVWTGQVQADTQAPATPSTLTGRSEPAQVILEWDGKDSSGQPMALDLKEIEVKADGVAKTWTMGLTNRTLRIDAGPGKDLAIGQTYTFRARASDYVPNWSAWSDPVHIAVRAEIAWPASPTGLTVEAWTATLADGSYVGGIDASWNAVAVDVDGQPVTVSDYPLHVRRTAGEFTVDWFHIGGSGGALSATHSSPLMTPGDTWEVAVGAFSDDGHTGPFSAAVAVVIPPDTVAPPTPSTPDVTSELGQLTVRSDGLTSTGGAMPPDLSHFEVHLTGITEPWLMDRVGRFLHLGAEDGLTLGTIYEVRLKAVDYAGNKSALSQPASATTVSAISGLQDAIDQVEADFAAGDLALQGQIDSIVLSSSGGIVTWMGATTPVAPAERPHLTGDLWWDTATKTQKRYNGSTWVVHQLGDAGLADFNASKLFGFVEAARIKVDTQWITEKLLIGNTDEVVVDPAWGNADLNADRALTGWTVAPGTVTRTAAGAGRFYLGLKSSWPDARMALRQGVRYRIEATVRLTTTGQVGITRRDTGGGDAFVTNVPSLAANTDYVLTGEHVWGSTPGAFGIYLGGPGTIKNVSVRPMLSQVLIADGLIQTPMLAAQSVGTDQLKFGAATGNILSADALNFKTAEGLVLTAPNIQSTTTANRGLKLSTTHKRVYDNSGNITLEENYSTGDVTLTGRFQTRGAYPHFDIGRGLWADFAGLQWTIGPGWQTKPEIITNASTWGIDTPGGLYMRGGNNHGLTMRPEVALRSGRPISGTPQYWPEVDLVLGLGSTTHGRRRLRDEGENKTSIYDWADFLEYRAKAGAVIAFPRAGTTSDIHLLTPGNIVLESTSGGLRVNGITTTTGGDDLRMEAAWRVAYQSSLSADKLDQRRMGALYELLTVPGMTWVDRQRREADPDFNVRYGGVIYEDVARVSADHGGSLDFLLIKRDGGKPSGINYNAIAPALLDIVADQERRIVALEAKRGKSRDVDR